VNYDNGKYRLLSCPRCGSNNTQTRGVAYGQSKRRTAGGNDSISEFGESISPPRPRSTFLAPLWTGIGMGCTALFVAAGVVTQSTDAGTVLLAITDLRAVRAAIAVGVISLIVHAIAAISHNLSVWPNEHRTWADGAVCRRCGHQFSSSLPATRSAVDSNGS
jgi:hypothetical protein